MKADFLNDLEVHLVSDNGRGLWCLDQDLGFCSVVANMVITAKKGFITDFASVPRLPLVFLLVGDTGDRAAVIHDYLYSTALLPRSLCDAVFREAAIATGVPMWRATMLYAGVRVFGGKHYGPSYTTD